MKQVKWNRIAASLAALAVLAVLAGCAQKQAASGVAAADGEVKIEVTDAGFVPAIAEVPKGKPVTLVVTRRTDQTCATAMVFAVSGEKHDLPLNQAVRIALPSDHADTLDYACPMDMIKGEIVSK